MPHSKIKGPFEFQGGSNFRCLISAKYYYKHVSISLKRRDQILNIQKYFFKPQNGPKKGHFMVFMCGSTSIGCNVGPSVRPSPTSFNFVKTILE